MARENPQGSALAIRLEINASPQALTRKHRHTVVTVNPFRRRFEDLEDLLEIKEPSYPRAIPQQRIEGGEEHPDIAKSLVNIGETYKAEGDYAQAEPLYHQALSVREKVYGPNNRYIARSYCNLIKFYSNWGKQKEADEAFNGMMSAVENAEKGLPVPE